LSTLVQKLNAIIKVPAQFITKMWRPLTCLWISASVFVNGVYIPLMKNEPADMVALAALITAVTAAFAVREWGKVKGVAE
jgi:hypothetical protein